MVLLKKNRVEFILLLVGCCLLFFQHSIAQISNETQMMILMALVCIVGVPHGALDFLVEEQTQMETKQVFYIKKFVAKYLFRLATFACIWVFPVIAFSLFMLISIFHFGETDMALLLKTKKHGAWLYATYGSFIFGLLLLVHLPQIKANLPATMNDMYQTAVFVFVEQFRYYILGLITIIFSATLVYFYINNNLIINGIQIIKFVLLIGILIMLPSLLAFTFYFALWHSILSIRNIFSYVTVHNNSTKLKAVVKKFILFSVAALVGMFGLYYALTMFMPDVNLLLALLLTLSVLTLPHLEVMHKMYVRLQKN
ncbi:Brp/Blh family beta-carotene 15,15'-dioxygenase [Ferruginibacter yonginensis]|uniref:Brp/Blh family beta-carotene 15,15'-dioxygenase n=1 Tax=Ferruginibacter yonginensis TaxID=1310416 RepID=A0ABV8QWD0_9BACT